MTTDWVTLQRYARVAGFAMLLSIIFGSLGEMVLPGKIVVMGDANATAANLLANPGLVRVSFATYLVEGICDLTLAGLFYILLKPVNRNLALLSVLFGIGAMVLYAVAQSSFYSASLAVGESAGMAAFTADQRNAIAMLAVRISYTIAGLFLILYGIATMLRGYLIARSRYLPKLLGILFMIGGAGFALRTITLLLAPELSSAVMLLPMAVGGIPLMLWLLLKGVRPNPQRFVSGAPPA
jgi:hypothetical protein